MCNDCAQSLVLFQNIFKFSTFLPKFLNILLSIYLLYIIYIVYIILYIYIYAFIFLSFFNLFACFVLKNCMHAFTAV